eukprot:g4068.t1
MHAAALGRGRDVREGGSMVFRSLHILNVLASSSLVSKGQLQALAAADVGLDATEPVEIVLLSEERSQQAAQILQLKGLESRPMLRARKMLACGERPTPEPRSQKLPVEVMREAQGRLGRFLQRRVPLLSWTRTVTGQSLRADLIAGLTVGVMVIPQSMSYASIAGGGARPGVESCVDAVEMFCRISKLRRCLWNLCSQWNQCFAGKHSELDPLPGSVWKGRCGISEPIKC